MRYWRPTIGTNRGYKQEHWFKTDTFPKVKRQQTWKSGWHPTSVDPGFQSRFELNGCKSKRHVNNKLYALDKENGHTYTPKVDDNNSLQIRSNNHLDTLEARLLRIRS